MRFGSLFAGIGGFDLGLERAGMTCAWQVEKDEYCNRVLEKHWPDVRRYGDVHEVGRHNLDPVELICGGFPCQPFSHAGKRAGKDDDRYLWPEMLRVVEELRPAWFLGENVAGIINVALDQVLSDLEGAGYQAQALVIPACAVDAPHRRDRVWILGYARQHRQPGGTVDDEASGRAADVADAPCELLDGSGVAGARGRREFTDEGGDVPADGRRGGEGQRAEVRRRSQPSRWQPEPDVGRVANGIPRRVDRLRALGNAVVPQVVEVIGRAIMGAR